MNINIRKAEPGDTGRYFNLQSCLALSLTSYLEFQKPFTGRIDIGLTPLYKESI
jgi:hypothetical protein